MPAHSSGRRPAPAATGYDADWRRHPLDLPPPSRDYMGGRAIARLITWLGGASALTGVGLTPLTIVSPETMVVVPVLGQHIGTPSAALTIGALGIGLFLLGQLTRAVFDIANASRDVARLTLAEAEESTLPPSGTHGRRARD